jgi:heme/copper-type cytochrome/quinol oxidase subunit 2
MDLRTFLNAARTGRAGLALCALAVLAVVFVPVPDVAERPAERRIRIAASARGFDPAVVRVSRGDRITIHLVATDVVHGLYLDGYGLTVTADPGRSDSLSFVADRSGAFRFRCSVTCGTLHPFLVGKLKVGRNDLLWRAIALVLLAGGAALWRGVR